MESLERIIALFLLSLDPTTPHATVADYSFDQLAECRLVAESLHQRIRHSPSTSPETLGVLTAVRDGALERMVGLAGEAAGGQGVGVDALHAADDRARTRLSALSDDQVTDVLGDCALAFGLVRAGD